MAQHDDETPVAGSAVEKHEPRQVSAGIAVVTTDVFENPGEPPHRDRVTDIDPAAERRAERRAERGAVGDALGHAVGDAQRVPRRGAQRVAVGLVDTERDGRPDDEPVARAVVVRGGVDDRLTVTSPS